MSRTPIAHFFLREGLRQRVQQGQHSFFNRVISVLLKAHFRIEFSDDSLAQKQRFSESGRFSFQVMQEPIDDLGVVVRKNYLDPFWHIERTSQRWERPVAVAEFNEVLQPIARATRFSENLRRSLFPSVYPPKFEPGYVYVPLQGRLLTRRSFQTCSPIRMIESVIENEPLRRVVVTLHPGERYTQAEMRAINSMAEQYEQVSVSGCKMSELLPYCHYVATQNSSVGLFGYFLHKPLVLFGAIDFHHLAIKVSKVGEKLAFESVGKQRLAYDQYIWWFFNQNSINARRKIADKKIAEALRGAGWPL
jgi:hypothetical protein